MKNMTLEEAIWRSQELMKHLVPEDVKAVKLGVEALKCIQIARASNAEFVDAPLLGETD